MELIGYFFAILMGLSLGMIGAGGSILTVPILVYFFKQDALVATTGSLFVVGVTALVGAAMNAKKGLVDSKTGIIFAIPSFAGVFAARRLLLPNIPDTLLSFGGFVMTKSLLVLAGFALLMIFASRAMIISGRPQALNSVDKISHSTASIAVKGFLVGATTGFVGAGGGFLIIPALVILLHIPIRTAIGTSLAIITANSLFGFAVSTSQQPINWTLLLTISGLGVAGLILGKRISSPFQESTLKKGFGYFVLVFGFFILVDQILKI